MKNQEEITLSNIPNEKYQKFFNQFSEITALPIEQWKVVHLLGYFVAKYKDTYQKDYQWKFNTPTPPKCFEVWQMKKLGAKLSTKPNILKDYIDWAFMTLVPRAKKRLTSISFLTKDDNIITYKMKILNSQRSSNIDRTTKLPSNYLTILEPLFISTYGDLTFACLTSPRPANLIEALSKLSELGFSEEILSRVV